MQHLDEGTIHTWLDGELPPAELDAVEAHIASCEQCAAAVAEARGFVAGSSRILLALDAVPGGVLPAPSHSSHAAPKPARFTVPRVWMAVAALLVLSTVSVVVTRSGSDAPLAKLDEARATRADAQVAAPAAGEPAAVVAAAPAEKSAGNSAAATPRSQEQEQLASGRVRRSADKSSSPVAREKKEEGTPASGLQSTSVADAPRAPAAVAGKSALPAQPPSPAPMANMDAKVQRDSNSVNALSAHAPKSVAADSARKLPPIVLGQIVVTGEGTTTATEKLGSTAASNDAPHLVSTSTSTEAGDTVVTTIYSVRDATVTLTERWPARDALRRRERNAGFSDQVMAKAREDTHIDSITWSDSSRHTRTLRGAVSRDDLERIRTALFGPTP